MNPGDVVLAHSGEDAPANGEKVGDADYDPDVQTLGDAKSMAGLDRLATVMCASLPTGTYGKCMDMVRERGSHPAGSDAERITAGYMPVLHW